MREPGRKSVTLKVVRRGRSSRFRPTRIRPISAWSSWTGRAGRSCSARSPRTTATPRRRRSCTRPAAGDVLEVAHGPDGRRGGRHAVAPREHHKGSNGRPFATAGRYLDFARVATAHRNLCEREGAAVFSLIALAAGRVPVQHFESRCRASRVPKLPGSAANISGGNADALPPYPLWLSSAGLSATTDRGSHAS